MVYAHSSSVENMERMAAYGSTNCIVLSHTSFHYLRGAHDLQGCTRFVIANVIRTLMSACCLLNLRAGFMQLSACWSSCTVLTSAAKLSHSRWS